VTPIEAAREADLGNPARRPLRNRINPFSEFHAVAARRAAGQSRRLAPSRRPEARDAPLGLETLDVCRGVFKGRRREEWGAGHAELFFLDEATALAAGDRPCFECRRGRSSPLRLADGRKPVWRLQVASSRTARSAPQEAGRTSRAAENWRRGALRDMALRPWSMRVSKSTI